MRAYFETAKIFQERGLDLSWHWKRIWAKTLLSG